MKVLMTAESSGGIWTYSVELARALGRRGVEVHLATIGAPLGHEQVREASVMRNVELHPGRGGMRDGSELAGGSNGDDVEATGRWLLALERRLRPDVVHLNAPLYGDLPFTAPVVAIVHSCALSWWWAGKGRAAPASLQPQCERFAGGLRGAEMVVAPTRAALEWTDFLHGPLHPVRVIGHGRSAADVLPRIKEPYVAAAARRWDDAKDLGLLESAARHLAWPVRVAGHHAQRVDRGRGPAPANGAGPATAVERMGHLDAEALADLLGRAAVFAHPVRYEPFGLTVLEAALAGCALVLSDIPSLREQWEGVAELVPPGDERALRDALVGLIEDPGRRRELAAASRLRALDQTPERVAGQYLEVYRQASAPHPRPLDLEGLLPGHARRAVEIPPGLA
ncbi:MAG TPA: glycosyltransferase family 4 protein [Thermoanaerobaculia bacterium]|nr:glycosyltransferase family 4 protein [Thermoanaerobaculia bacterium]